MTTARHDVDLLLREVPDDIRVRSRVGHYVQWLERERGLQFDAYQELWQWSVDHLDDFWQSIWDHFGVIAHDEPTAVLGQRTMPGAQWFPGATLNYAEHALRGDSDRLAVIARSQTREEIRLTVGELRAAVAAARAGLEQLGVRRGDRVAGYLPNTPEAVIALLATASIGAIWACCSPDFGPRGVIDRLHQIEPTVLIAVDGYRYGSRAIDRRDDREAIIAGLPTLRGVVEVPYLHSRSSSGAGRVSWTELTSQPASPEYEPVAFDNPLWILFSSGTTGLPKAIVHGHGGVVLEMLKSHALQQDLGSEDRLFYVAPTAWVVWNLLVSGLLVGSTIVLFDGDPATDHGRELWRTLSATSATAFCCGATFLLLNRAGGAAPRDDVDLRSLRSLASTGSPLPPEGFVWVYENVAPTPDFYLQSTSGGTDVCGAFVGGSPWLPVRAGKIAGRCLGVDVHAVDRDGRRVIGELGELVVDQPMPSMPVSFWNDPDGRRYRESYFAQYPGRWRHGDWIVFDEDGACLVTGRSDATLNRGGVRLGTAEFYGVLDEFTDIADGLVVHLEDMDGGLGELILFVQMRADCDLDDDLVETLNRTLRARLSPRHAPDLVVPVEQVPYNLTGKKLEVPVKRILQGVPREDVVSDAALRDPRALDAFEKFAEERS